MIPAFLIRYLYFPLYKRLIKQIGREFDFSNIDIAKKDGYYLFSRADTKLSNADALRILEVFEQKKKDKRSLSNKEDRYALEIKYDGRSYFVKQYTNKCESIKYPGISLATHNLIASLILEKLNVKTPRVEYTIEKKKGLLQEKCFLIADFITNSQPLCDYVPDYLPKNKRKDFFKNLAKSIAILHENGFIHGDPNPYNIRIKERDVGWDVYLIDLDSAYKYQSIGIEGRIRNLAQIKYESLDMRELRIRDNLYFLREYLINSPSLNFDNIRMRKAFIDSIIQSSLKMADQTRSTTDIKP